MATNFDDLSKALAGGVSRKHALKLMGAAMGGGIAALMHLDRVGAAPDPCQVFCGKTANISGPQHAACIQACHQCNADLSRVCFGPTSITCCAPGTFCVNGTCSAPLVCGAGTFGTCSINCVGTTGVPCTCSRSTEGNVVCAQPVCTGTPCTTSADCGTGSICFTDQCCGTGNFCQPLCT
jgi:hypothetical protein